MVDHDLGDRTAVLYPLPKIVEGDRAEFASETSYEGSYSHYEGYVEHCGSGSYISSRMCIY